jgi:hypothetical protein
MVFMIFSRRFAAGPRLISGFSVMTPCLEQLPVEVVAVPEMPVKSTLRDAESVSQSLDPNPFDTLERQDLQRGIEPFALADALFCLAPVHL